MRWLRCTLVDDDRDIDMTVDVLVDEQDRVRPGLSYFGSWRNSDGTYYPLTIVGLEGDLDFGSNAGGPKDRYGTLPLHGRTMWEGAFFQYKDAQDQIELKAIRCHDLIAEHQENANTEVTIASS